MEHRGYKYRAYPSAEQQQLLLQTFGSVRFVWNAALEERKRNKSSLKSSFVGELRTKQESSFLQEVPSTTLYNTLRHLEEAYVGFFKKNKQYPKFKSKKKSKQSAEFQIHERDLRDGGVRLMKLGVVPIVWHRPLPEGAEVRMATASVDASGRWWISLSVRYPNPKPLPAANGAVGIDLGLTHLATLSTGEKIINPRHEKADRLKLAKAQRAYAKKEKGSKNQDKARKKVARVYARIADRRRDSLHKTTTRIVRENQTIVIEDLSVKNMVKNHSLARSISDASWGTFRSMLEYKCETAGRQLVVIDKWYPSSKTCSACGHVAESLPLSVREWDCQACNTKHDRDTNAAVNILAVGLTVTGCGDAVRPDGQKSARHASTKQQADQATDRNDHNKTELESFLKVS